MKKLFMLAAIATMTICTANAQLPVKYRGEVDLGYSVGVGTFGTGRINLHTIQGVKIGKHFSTGIGFGVDYYHVDIDEIFIPIYLNLKGYLFASDRFSPYLSLDVGIGTGATEGVSGLSGWYCTPAIGVKAAKFKVQLGYNIQNISESGLGFNANAIQIKVGLMF